ncbi:MAG: hypothetical protein A3F84_04425 [Candidatus Handelsmanbacteria bacterium RIFCSPLOWO2_12_FULL_64_10]|uniref:PilZ domain-containing protein n=1 Tax=Handelsmanbacteria sp. (strain RIFCSPLOWO2_12_FULL_64_10) TaxID=1817868 RepID=A0A1F6C5Z0_HANXR|nr:MAG: hypothetical protein A3F84_04425 [Candidatus Handelsmanbacteria bacterium RIFCSPLOWO2_12_FULL_64_10]
MGEDTDRRLQDRYALPATLYHEADGNVVTFTAQNISLGGAFVLTPDPLPVGTRLVLFLDLPKRGPLEIRPGSEVTVVRHTDEGMALRFIDPTANFLAVLREEFKRVLQAQRRA